MMISPVTVLIRGAGEIASGVAHRLRRSHFWVCLTETSHPLAVCRGTAFSEAVFDGTKTIEGVTAELVPPSEIDRAWNRGNIAVVIDPDASVIERLKPDVVVDAIMAKRNTGTRISDAPLVIGLGPGFHAGSDVHLVVETSHRHQLGAMIRKGQAEPNDGAPVTIGSLSRGRVAWATQAGVFTSPHDIGDTVAACQEVGRVDNLTVAAPVSGILRGLLRSGVRVTAGDKLIEVDPQNDRSICYTIRDKMKTVADGVLAAIETGLSRERTV
ncbi:selenium-dependent molybdenum cofactor biosynthesis protein YqeB [Chloroflexota bacterium]